MAMREVTVACSETADLPCTAPWDPQLSYTVSWAKLSEGGKERMELPQSRQNSSFEAPTKSYSLTIQNTTICSSGTYRCALQELGGQRNFSGTVILKVTGCPKEAAESPFRKYRAEAVLLCSLVIFYLTLIIFTCGKDWITSGHHIYKNLALWVTLCSFCGSTSFLQPFHNLYCNSYSPCAIHTRK
ncbi:CD83 antigen-like protein [Cricetulus griseus]|nr:CD83 antigen-like protein [Cricetulus griseus]